MQFDVSEQEQVLSFIRLQILPITINKYNQILNFY